MIWATVSSRLVFADCIQLLHLWLQRMSSMWFQYWPFGDVHMQSHLLSCWKRVFAITSAFSWQNSYKPLPCFILYSKAKLAFIPGISWLPAFVFQSLWWIGLESSFFFFFLILVLRGLPGLIELISFFGISGWGIYLNYCDVESSAWKWTKIILSFLRLHPKYSILDSFVDYEGYSISSMGFLPTVVDIMIIWVKLTHSHPF